MLRLRMQLERMVGPRSGGVALDAEMDGLITTREQAHRLLDKVLDAMEVPSNGANRSS